MDSSLCTRIVGDPADGWDPLVGEGEGALEFFFEVNPFIFCRLDFGLRDPKKANTFLVVFDTDAEDMTGAGSIVKIALLPACAEVMVVVVAVMLMLEFAELMVVECGQLGVG